MAQEEEGSEVIEESSFLNNELFVDPLIGLAGVVDVDTGQVHQVAVSSGLQSVSVSVISVHDSIMVTTALN